MCWLIAKEEMLKKSTGDFGDIDDIAKIVKIAMQNFCMAKLTNLTNLKRNFAYFAKIVMQNFSALGNAEHITPIVQI